MMIHVYPLCVLQLHTYIHTKSQTQVAETFTFDKEEIGLTAALSDVARLDTCVSVVDAVTFMDNWLSVHSLQVHTQYTRASYQCILYCSCERIVVLLWWMNVYSMCVQCS
jgi:hypothetical protein